MEIVRHREPRTEHGVQPRVRRAMHWTAFSVVLLMAGARAADQSGASADTNFAGRWVADLSKSNPSPTFAYQHFILEFAVARDTVRISSVVVDQSGREQRFAETFQNRWHRTSRCAQSGWRSSAG